MPLSEPVTVYSCQNSECPVASFSGGILKEQAAKLSKDPEILAGNEDPPHWGEGYCSTCGEKGKVAEKGVTFHVADEDAQGPEA